MFRWLRTNLSSPEWKPRQLANGWFTIVLPSSWKMTAEETFTTFDDPAGTVCVGVIVSMRRGMTLNDFAAACFASKKPPLQPIGEAEVLTGPGWEEGVVKDFVDTSVAEPRDEMERVACFRCADLYAKVTFYCSESWLRGPDCARAVTSVQLVGMRVLAES